MYLVSIEMEGETTLRQYHVLDEEAVYGHEGWLFLRGWVSLDGGPPQGSLGINKDKIISFDVVEVEEED